MVLLALKILLTEFIAEMGDKTQLMLVAMTSKFKLRDIILGTAVAILVLNGVAVLAGGIVGALIPDWIIKFIAAAAFLFFALTSLQKENGEEEEAKASGAAFAPLAVFSTFFVAELGDKTQLTAITFGANEIAAHPGESRILIGVIVWLACSVGLFAADILGMLLGYLLKSKAPAGILNTLAFVIFTVFGIYTLYQAFTLTDTLKGAAILLSVIAAVIFALLCLFAYRKNRKSN